MKGTVAKIATKTGRSRRGQWTLYSFITQDESGNENGWVTFGFEAPPFHEGDFIEYETETDQDGRVQYKKGTGKIIPRPKQPEQPTRAEQVSSQAAAGGNSQSSGSASLDARQQSIVLQHSQEMAIKAVTVLLQNDSLPTTGAKTKAGEAKRFEEIVAAIDKLTVKYFNDVVSGRLLSNVPDMGIINTAPDAQIPAEQPGTSSSKQSEY